MWKFLRATILFSILCLCLFNVSGANPTKYQVKPNLIILGETGNVVGTQFTVNVTVSDAVDLYGLDTHWLILIASFVLSIICAFLICNADEEFT